MTKHYIGIDLGGTHIAAGIVNDKGQVLSKAEKPTLAERPYQDVVRDMGACCHEALEQAELQVEDAGGIGIGIPGVADNTTGTVIFCTNLGWHNIPLRDELQRHINLPVLIDNDATVAGYAENVAGVSRNVSSSVFLTLGTGVGGGIVMDGKPWTGAHGVASEIGHLTVQMIDGIPCTCGKSGCLERYCSATALIRMARERCEEEPGCSLMRAADGNPKNITGRMVIDLAKEGDPMALAVFHQYAANLAVAINNIVSFMDPQMVVLGGGISHAGEFLLNAIRERIPNYLMYQALPYAEVTLASLGNEAGIIGAALLCSLGQDYSNITTQQ